MAILSGLAGALLVLLVLGESFEAMVLPRRVTRRLRLTRAYYRAAWLCWAGLSRLIPGRRRDGWLSVFGPLSLLALFGLWATGLVFGFGLVQHGLAPAGVALGDSLYL